MIRPLPLTTFQLQMLRAMQRQATAQERMAVAVEKIVKLLDKPRAVALVVWRVGKPTDEDSHA